MSTKRDKPQEGLHGTILPKNTGAIYTVDEYNLIFFLTIHGIMFETIGRILHRPEICIERAWKRLCENASDYPGAKEYQIQPFDIPLMTSLCFRAKEYIRCQMKYKLANEAELAYRLGCSLDMVRRFVREDNCNGRKEQKKRGH